MGEKWNDLKVTIKHKVVSSHYHCKDAVIVQVKNGIDALRFEEALGGYQFSINGESIFSVKEGEFCPTCGGYLYRGYGEQNLSMKDAMKIGENFNEKYEGIENAVDKIALLLGLLRDGDYMVADYELFPYVKGKHFWEFSNIPDSFDWRSDLSLEHYRFETRPAHLIASERASLCNSDRVDTYMQRLCEEEAYPRAIGVLLSSDTVLLLDGHHKVAASTAKGKMAKCLVILPIKMQDNQKPIKTMLHKDRYLLDDTGKIVGYTNDFLREGIAREICVREIVKVGEFSDRGRTPEKYKSDLDSYARIPKDNYDYYIYDNFANAKRNFQYECDYFFQKKEHSCAEVIMFLKWHQILNWEWSKDLKDTWPGCVLRIEQMRALNRLGYQFNLDKDPKTANLLYGMFSFLEGQTIIDEIPSVLLKKVETEEIKTILIPRTVKYVKKSVFKEFPYLEKIVVQEGNPYLKEEDFLKVLVSIKEKREEKGKKKGSLHHYPFADIGKLLGEKKHE